MNVRHLTFRLLQVYIAVVRTGSSSAAASQLHLTQPTVSQQIKRLTEAVGQELLELKEGRYTTSHVGRELYNAAVNALACFDDFNLFLDESRQGIKGHIHIGVVTTAKYLLAPILAAFSKDFPDVQITFNIGNRGDIVKRFENQLDDLYLFSHPPTGDKVIRGRFLRNPLVVITPIDHWSLTRKKITFPELLSERFLMREQGSATRMVFENWLREQNYQLNKTMQIESNEVIRMSVENGLGLAVLSEHSLAQSQARIGVLKPEGFPLLSHWYLVRHADRHPTAATRNLVEFIRKNLSHWMAADYIRNELDDFL